MLRDADLVAFVSTTDPERAVAFYGGVLGLAVVHRDGFAVVFDANGTVLRVSVVERFTPQEFTVLGWTVADIADSVRGLAERGVETVRYPWFEQDELGVWTTPDGSRVAWFNDPDGNLLSVTQPAG